MPDDRLGWQRMRIAQKTRKNPIFDIRNDRRRRLVALQSKSNAVHETKQRRNGDSYARVDYYEESQRRITKVRMPNPAQRTPDVEDVPVEEAG